MDAFGWKAGFRTPFIFFGLVIPALAITIAAESAHAGLILDSSLLYYSTTVPGSTTDTVGKTFGGFSVSGTIDKAFHVGWTLDVTNFSDNPGSGATTLSGMEMGPRFGVYFGKSRALELAVAWLASSNGTYAAAGGSAESWSGMGFQGELGYAPEITEIVHVGFKLVYAMNLYSKKTDSANTTSNVSYTRTDILPTLYISLRY